MNRAPLNWRRHRRTAMTLTVMAGLIATAAGVQATAASWTDSTHFTATVSAATSSTTTTTTTTTTPPTTTTIAPQPDPFVRVTSICRGPTTYTVRVRNESTVTVDFRLQRGNTTISGPHTISGANTEQFYEIPNGTNGVRAVPAGAWTNSYNGTASTPANDCTPTTTTTSTTTTTTTPPPPSATSGGISAGNNNTVISAITWDITRTRRLCTTVDITGVADDPRAWSVDIDLTAAPWYGSSPDRLVLSGSGVIASSGPTSVVITGRNTGNGAAKFNARTNNTPITNSQFAQLEICNNQAPVPAPAEASTYDVDVALGTWTEAQACLVVTVSTTRSDLASYPFFYGWSTTIGLTEVIEYLRSTDREPVSITFDPKPNGANDYTVAPATDDPVSSAYTFTSGYDWALRAAGGGADSHTFSICVDAS